MHDPDPISFSWLRLIITKVGARFGSQRTGTFSEKVDFTNTHTHTRSEIRYRLNLNSNWTWTWIEFELELELELNLYFNLNWIEFNQRVVLCQPTRSAMLPTRSAMSSISTFHSHKLSIVLMRYYVDGGRVGRRECHNDAMKCTRVGL